MNSGKVVAVGSGLRDREGNLIPVSVKEGDTVLLPEFGGTQVKLGDKEYVLFSSSSRCAFLIIYFNSMSHFFNFKCMVVHIIRCNILHSAFPNTSMNVL